MLEHGVKDYITCKAIVEQSFPIDLQGNPHIACELCNYYSRYNQSCNLTEEIIWQPNRYVGAKCPLELAK